MADVTVKAAEDFETVRDGRFFIVGKGLGVSAWGMNLHELGAGDTDYPEHDHSGDGQEEVYLVLAGSATLRSGDETWELRAGHFARVGPDTPRHLTAGGEGARILAIGGTPGRPYGA